MINTLLESTRGGLDQSTTTGRRIPTNYICRDCLNGSSCVVFPGSHRPRLTGYACLNILVIASTVDTAPMSIIKMFGSEDYTDWCIWDIVTFALLALCCL